MKPIVVVFMHCTVCLIAAFASAQSPRQFEPDEEVIEQARLVIGKLQATKCDRERRVLIFGRSGGPHRDSIPTGTAVLSLLGDMTGAYKPVVAKDLSEFEAERLNRYDAVCFCNTTGAVFRETIDWKEFTALPEEERKREQAESDRLTESLLQFIRGGGGFVGIHAATDCLRDSDAYLDMIGGQFWQHPWNGDQMVTVRVEEPKHPLIRGIFSGDEFRIGDEIYQFRDPYSRKDQKILLSINIEKSDTPHLPLLREDRDYPVSWIRDYGKGQVFYSSLGHRKETYDNPQILECWLRGMQFVLGDLPTENSDG